VPIPVQLARHGEPGVSRRPRLGDVLVSCGLLTDEQLHEALLVQREAEGGRRRRLGQIIVDKGFLTEQQLAQAFADLLGLEFVDLARQHLDPDVVRMLPRQVAERTKMLVIARTADSGGDGHKGTGIGGFGGHGGGLTVAAADPTNVVALDDVRVYTGATALNVVVCTQSQIRERIAQAWALGDADADADAVADEVDPLAGGLNDADLVTAADQAPTVRLASSILADAVRVGASDIHVEPQADGMRIRYRVDGLLRPIRRVPRSAAAALVSRLKIVSGLDIAERRLPQDGRARLHVDGVAIDARVSTLPSVHGEKVVVRLLASGESVSPVAQLGLEVNQLEAVLAASLAPQGLLLITGPTGSGKTHTLYSLLSHIATPEKNVVTLEDPVEIQLPGITQVQIKHRTGLTFARGLRSVLRQDPDVVLVGEVRDTETAELALQASLTGHLVLTTLHTNDAVAALTRVVDMGVQPFLLASSLSLVVAQRLVRRPCRDCAAPYSPSERVLTLLGLTAADIADATPMRGRGCAACGNTGYRGRTGIFEVLPVTASVRSVLLRTPTEAALGAAARAAGMTTLRASALARARSGETTFEEVLRVTHVDLADGRRCSACDRALADDMIACPWCVTVVDRGHCVSCARPLESGWKICPWCRTPATAPPGDTQPATSMRRPRLLFVGQNESLRASIRSAADDKMDVDTATTADAALAALGRNDYDGVIVQQSLADLAGLELLRMLRTNAETAALPLMLVRGAGTDVTEPENPVLLSRAGLDDVLTMPADDEAVRARLVALADRSPYSRQLG
jgi:type IV pilus assembly protein PilB